MPTRKHQPLLRDAQMVVGVPLSCPDTRENGPCSVSAASWFRSEKLSANWTVLCRQPAKPRLARFKQEFEPPLGRMPFSEPHPIAADDDLDVAVENPLSEMRGVYGVAAGLPHVLKTLLDGMPLTVP